jgi:predicted dehydrogenase
VLLCSNARDARKLEDARARAIREGKSHHPTFETAVDLHRLVDAVKEASDNGREVALE